MKPGHVVILAVILTFGACQQLPTEPTPIDLSEEQPIAVPDTAYTDEDVEVSIDDLANAIFVFLVDHVFFYLTYLLHHGLFCSLSSKSARATTAATVRCVSLRRLSAL